MKIAVTGASRGIGYETALLLAAGLGHEVLVLSRNGERLRELQAVARKRRRESSLVYLEFDLAQPDLPALGRLVERMGGLDVLINNAGLLINKPFTELTMEDWRRSFEVNFFGVVALTRFLLPWLEASRAAHIVNVSSMGGFQGSVKFPGLAAYSAGKAAVANLTECLAEELKDRGVSVNCLAFGAVGTEMLQEAFPGYEAPVSSEQMGGFVADFATSMHHFFNGKVLPVSVSTP